MTSQRNLFKILLIGETGSGKTSFLNLVCNNPKMTNLLRSWPPSMPTLSQAVQAFNDPKLENTNSRKTESKTCGAKMYKAKLGGLPVGIIDSPGYGDTRGLEQDKKNTKIMIKTLQDEEYINCVCLIINGRMARLTDSIKYAVSEITGVLPREILDNVIVLFTNVARDEDPNFDSEDLTDFFGRSLKHIFFIENPFCKCEQAIKGDQNAFERKIRTLKTRIEETTDTLGEMSNLIGNFPRVHTNVFTKLYNKKQEVEFHVIKMLSAYENQERFEKMVSKAQLELDAALKKQKLFAEYHHTQTAQRMIVVKTERHNTLCGAPGCFSNCHVPCYLDKAFDKEIFRQCAAMGGGDHCSVCKHEYKHHYHNEALHEEQTFTKEFVDEEMKQKFKEAKTQEERARHMHEDLTRQLSESQEERTRISESLVSKIEEFQNLGVSRNYAKLIENQLAVIALRLESADSSEAQPLRKTYEQLEKKLKLIEQTLKRH